MVNEFGKLLSEGITSVAAKQGRTKKAVEQDIATERDYSIDTVRRWRRGYPPLKISNLEYLVEYCVTKGRVDRDWAERLLHHADYQYPDQLLNRIFGVLSERIPCNLPAKSEAFVGREKELADLRKFLSSRHRAGVICISGSPGVGKTALALEVAHLILKQSAAPSIDEKFKAIVWVTAKHTEFLPSGVSSRMATLSDLDSIYTALAEVLDLSTLKQAPTPEIREIIVMRALNSERVLLVLDNLEDVDDPAVLLFLRDLPPPSKAIVTTRHSIDSAVQIRLRPLEEDKALELIGAECERHQSNGHSIDLTKEQTEKLLDRTGGLPLIIILTIGRMVSGGSVDAELERLGDREAIEDILTFCFTETMSDIKMKKDTYRLFMALALFASDASRKALGYVAGFGEDILSPDAGLKELEVLSLVNNDNGRFSLETLTRVQGLKELESKANSEFKSDARKRLLEWYHKLADEISHLDSYASLHVEATNLLAVLDGLVAHHDSEALTWYLRHVHRFLFAEGYWLRLLNYSDQVFRWARRVKSKEALDALAVILQSYISVCLKITAVERGTLWLDRVQSLSDRLPEELADSSRRLRAEVLLGRGRLLEARHTSRVYDRGNKEPHFDERLEILQAALAAFKGLNLPDRVMWTLNSLGNLFLFGGELDQAKGYYHQALSALEGSEIQIVRTRRWAAAIRGNIAHVKGGRGDNASDLARRKELYEDAKKRLYEIRVDLTDPDDLAEADIALAYYEHMLGNEKLAKELRTRADARIRELGISWFLCPEDIKWRDLGLSVS